MSASGQSGPERFLRIPEAAEVMGVSVRTVYRLIAEGQLAQPLKVRGCSRLAESDLASFRERIMRERRR